MAWRHLAKAKELFHADPSISHFLFTEDDIHITQANMIWWPQTRKNHKQTASILAYCATKVHPATTQLYSSDVIALAVYEDTSKLVFKNGSHVSLNLNYPCQGLALMDRELLEEYLQMPAAEINKSNWGIRDKANQGLTFWNGPPDFQCRPMVGYQVNNQRIDPRCLVHHLPNSYGSDSKAEAGKVALAGVVRHMDS